MNVVVAWVVVEVVAQTPRALQTSSTILPSLSSSAAAVLWPEFWPEFWVLSRTGAAVVVVVFSGKMEGHRAAPEQSLCIFHMC